MAGDHPRVAISRTGARSPLRQCGFVPVLKNSCRSGSDPGAVIRAEESFYA